MGRRLRGEPVKTVHAVAGIIRNDDEVLAVRCVKDETAGLWEFPSGEPAPGETAEDACRRELKEQLNADITNLCNFYTVEYDHDETRLSMECFFCDLELDGSADEAAAIGAERTDAPSDAGTSAPPLLRNKALPDIRWIPRRSLAELSWAPADRELVRVLSESDASEDEKLVKARADNRKSMQGNKRANTKPEMLVRQRLREAGLPGYRLQWKKAPGTPDIAYPGRKVAIFVNGCFWHRCPYCRPSTPKRNAEFWEAKFRRNVERDAEVQHELDQLGWTTIVIWECQLKPANIDETMERVVAQVRAAKTSVNGTA